jgi:gluconokinase
MTAIYVIIVMGVSGCGKTAVGRRLAEKLQCTFKDADDLHPKENVRKMTGGLPLTDEDRFPWLNRICCFVNESTAITVAKSVVVACSALKRSYRDILQRCCRVRPIFVHLSVSLDVVHGRVLQRQDHFMPIELLQSQFHCLEEPTEDENAIIIDVSSQSVEEIADFVSVKLAR